MSADWNCSHLLLTKAISFVLDDLTDLLSGENYASISSIRSVTKDIHEEALIERDDDVSLIRDIYIYKVLNPHSRFNDAIA